MMKTFLALSALLLAVPTVADAQGRTRGDKTANWDQIESANPSGPRVTRKDVEAFSGIGIVVDRRKDLKLSDDQVRQLRDLARREEGAVEPRFAAFDSLRAAMRSRAGVDADEERARTTIARQELMTAIGAIRSVYDSTLTGALSVLDETQRTMARDVVAKAQTEADEKLRERFRGTRTGGGGGGGGGVRRP